MLLSIPHPYEFKRLVDVLSRFAVRPTFRLSATAYWRGLRIGDAAGVVRLSEEGDGLRATLYGWNEPPEPRALERAVRALAGLHLDLAPFYARARLDASLWAWLRPLAGLPLFSSADLYEALVTTIIEQHISWTAALGVQARFAALFGTPIATPVGVVYAPPAPAQIAALTRADLAPLKLTTARLDLLIRASQLIAEGAFDGWEQADPSGLYHALLRVKGIGHWTATVTVGRALGVQPHLHDNDAALQAAVNAFFYQRAGRASLDETRAAFAPYGKDAPLIAQLLMMRWVIAQYVPQPFDLE